MLRRSEASKHHRKFQRAPSNHPARSNLAYTTRRVSKGPPGIRRPTWNDWQRQSTNVSPRSSAF
ncbi:DUF1589 domain-containing protein [Rhodopirellula bahusiensis]